MPVQVAIISVGQVKFKGGVPKGRGFAPNNITIAQKEGAEKPIVLGLVNYIINI